MKDCGLKTWTLFTIAGLLAMGLLGCAGAKPGSQAQVAVLPDQVILSPLLIKTPIEFKGSGFAAKELVVVEMVVPAGVKVKTIPEGERVGLAYTHADEQGDFHAQMPLMTTLNWLFQVDWTADMKPDFKNASPLPPGEYEIMATGMDSDVMGRAVLEIMPPPRKGS